MDADDDTGRFGLMRLANSNDPDVRVIGRELGKLVAAAERERGARAFWRVLGSLAATAALGIASWALTLAQTAATDHDRLGRVEVVVERQQEQTSRLERDTRSRLEPITVSLARIETATSRIESRLEAVEERIVDVERGRRRRGGE